MNTILFPNIFAYLSLQESISAVNDIGGDVIKDRIEKMGITESGAYNFYNVRVSRNEFSASYERQVIAILSQLPLGEEYHEIGMGAGSLVFSLALTGRRSIGIEYDKRRFDCAIAIYNKINSKYPFLINTCTLLKDAFPYAVSHRDVSKSIAISTNFIATITDEMSENIIKTLSTYRAIVIDTTRFIKSRSSDDEINDLINKFEELGMKCVGEVLNLRSDGRFFAFRRLDSYG